jgi:hypothetical protein
MITYKLNNDLSILETTFTGDVSIKEITEYILTLSNDKNLPKELKILTDGRKVKVSVGVTPKDLTKLSDVNK